MSEMVKRDIFYTDHETVFSELLNFIKERTYGMNINSYIIASNKGRAALKVKECFGDCNVVSITEFTYSEDMKKQMKKHKIIPVEKVSLPIQDRRSMKEGLLFFGEGMKAALEVSSIAAEKGLVKGTCIAIAGGKGGFDTVILVKPSSFEFFDSPDPKERMQVLEILALPSRS
jgi:hypothetical protein